MNADRLFFATGMGCMAGLVTTCVSHFPVMFEKRAEYDALWEEAVKVINEAINLELPPSLKTVWLNNLSGITTTIVIIAAAAFIATKVDQYVKDDIKKFTLYQIATGVTTVTASVFTFYLTGSLGLLGLSAVGAAAPFIFRDDKGASPVIAAIVALIGRTECSLRENLENKRNYANELSKHYNEYLDYNNGVARKAGKICNDMVYSVFGDMGKKMGISILATGLGTTFGAFTAKKMGMKDKQQQNQVAAVIGAVTTGAFSFYFTGSKGLSLANAGISAIAPLIRFS